MIKTYIERNKYLSGMQKLVNKIIKMLAQDKRIQFAYIYGSILKRHDARDIDIAIYTTNKHPFRPIQEEIAGKLEKSISYTCPVDVHELNSAPVSFVFQVISDGKLIWERNHQQRLTWEAHTLSNYQDLKPMLDFYDRRFLAT